MDYEKQAIEWLKLGNEMSFAYYDKPLLLCYSGGKDSDVILELAKRSGIQFEIQHSHTTVDAPQTVQHIRNVFYELECQGHKPIVNAPTYKGQRVTMWTLIPQKLMPPTRIMRYCCSVLKEQAGANRMIITGVRKSESGGRMNRGALETIANKKANKAIYQNEDSGQTLLLNELFLNNDNGSNRRFIEHCMGKNKSACNPIIEFDDGAVWDYIRSEKIKTNPLYKEGFHRVGCIGCPMASKMREVEFQMFPTYKTAYIHSFDRMIAERKARGLPREQKTGEEVFLWWIENKTLEGQMSFEEI